MPVFTNLIKSVLNVSNAVFFISASILLGYNKTSFAQDTGQPQMQSMSLEQLMYEQAERTKDLMQRIENEPQDIQGIPNIDTFKTSGVDLDALLKKYDTLKNLPKQAEEGLFVLISMSMPKASLDRLVTESALYGFPLILRGMIDNDWMTTLAAIQTLTGNIPATVQIDPRLFTRFDVKSVPTTIVVSSATEQSMAVQGDVSIEYALEAIAASESPVKVLAEDYLNRMRSK